MIKQKNNFTPLADGYLEIGSQEQSLGPDEFFYTRLKARMDREINTERYSRFNLRPAILLVALTVLLCVNSFLLVNHDQTKNNISEGSSIETFASSYDLTVSTPY